MSPTDALGLLAINDDVTLGAERIALDHIAWGALLIAVGAFVHGVLALVAAAGKPDLHHGWWRALGWALITAGAVLNAHGAGILAGWW